MKSLYKAITHVAEAPSRAAKAGVLACALSLWQTSARRELKVVGRIHCHSVVRTIRKGNTRYANTTSSVATV